MCPEIFDLSFFHKRAPTWVWPFRQLKNSEITKKIRGRGWSSFMKKTWDVEPLWRYLFICNANPFFYIVKVKPALCSRGEWSAATCSCREQTTFLRRLWTFLNFLNGYRLYSRVYRDCTVKCTVCSMKCIGCIMKYRLYTVMCTDCNMKCTRLYSKYTRCAVGRSNSCCTFIPMINYVSYTELYCNTGAVFLM